jgi:hypothetical protein
MYVAATLLASATFDRWAEGFGSGFAKGAVIGLVIWGVLKLLRGKSN